MYKYLLWDMDGTIFNFEASQTAAIKALFRKYRLGDCSDEMLEEYSKINQKYWEALERGEIQKSDLLVRRFKDFFSEYGIDTNLAERFNEDYQIVLGDFAVLEKDAENVLRILKDGYRQIVITNGTKVAQDKKLRLSGLDKVFDAIYISEVVGVEKPAKEYFDYVIEKEGIKDLREVLIIGDSLTSDILGGVRHGIDTCWYNPFHKKNKSKDVKPTYEIEFLMDMMNVLNR